MTSNRQLVIRCPKEHGEKLKFVRRMEKGYK
jgi:hypothetical protein